MGDRKRKGGKWDLYEDRKLERKLLKMASVSYLLITAYDPIKNTNAATFFYFNLMFSEVSNKILYARKCKFILGLKNRISEYDVFLLVTQAYSDKVKKIRVLPTGVEPMTFRLQSNLDYPD